MHRRTYLAALVGGSTAGLAGCSALNALGDLGDEPCSGEDCDIGMTRNSFVPAEYEVRVGDTVVWRNTSSAKHTVTAYENAIPDDAVYFATGDYESEAAARDAWDRGRGGIDRGETFEHTFEIPGEYGYVCIPHEPGMAGTILVTD